MRRLASFLLLGVALAAGATDIWRWKDADGVVHYSDSPVPGAVRVETGGATRPATPGNVPPVATSTPVQPTTAPMRYSRCEVVQPENDETFFAIRSISVSLAIEPFVQSGHHVQLLLNGTAYPKWPDGAVSGPLTDLNRGTYTIGVRVMNEDYLTVCTGPTIQFHIRQPSVLSPQSPQRAKPPAKK
jgi:hypothetical protein